MLIHHYHNGLHFVWDSNKDDFRHKLHFADAATVFFDLSRGEKEDDCPYEERYDTVRTAKTPTGPVIIFLTYTMRGDAKRIISARPAEKKEIKDFEYDLQGWEGGHNGRVVFE